MPVKALLTGHQFDLQTLSDLFPEGSDPSVRRDGDEYYLTSAELDRLTSNLTQQRESALSLLRQVNGVAWALRGGYRPVTLADRFTDDTGSTTVVAAASLEMRLGIHATAVVISGDVEQPAPPPPGAQYIAKIADNPDAIEVLHILGRSARPLNWVDLYKVLEIIRLAVGGEGAIKAIGWASDREINTFRESANRREISGSDARHARCPGSPSGRSMSIDEGREFIRGLADKWLDSL